jgi:hypothetical protein
MTRPVVHCRGCDESLDVYEPYETRWCSIECYDATVPNVSAHEILPALSLIAAIVLLCGSIYGSGIEGIITWY